MNLENFFNPKSIAVIGATEKLGKIGNILVKNLLDLGYEGEILPINPKYKQILGLECYSSILEIKREIDLIIVAVPAPLVYQVIDDSTERSKNFIVISAGFSETGKEGKRLEEKLNNLSGERELNILGPNCLGFINPSLNLNASFASDLPRKGRVAFLSQSGALAVALLDQAQERRLGFSKVISLGNKMEIGENEILEFLENDEETKAIGMYLESLEDGQKFMQLASRISQKKPVIILKAGKSQRAKEAMLSHTGSLAGETKVARAAFQEAGIIEAKDTRQFMNLLSLFSRKKCPKNEEAIVITNAGGPGVLATDVFENKKIKLAQISSEIKKKLQEFLPIASSLNNPIDLLGDALEDRFEKTLEIFKSTDPEIIFCLLTPQDQTPVKDIAEVLQNFSKKYEKIIIPVFIGGKKVEETKKEMARKGMLVFDYPEEAIDTLNYYFEWFDFRGNFIEDIEVDEERKSAAQRIIEKAGEENRKMLNAFEAEEILNLYGIKTSQIFKAEGSGFDFPVVLKVDSEEFIHKTDQGGVMLNIKNQEELDRAVQKMREKFAENSLIVQKQEKEGEEIILGIKQDKAFGSVVAYGLGGIFTEVFQKVDFVFNGMNQEALKKSVEKSSIEFMFRKFRGQKPLNIEKFSQILFNLLTLARELPEIREMDVNPLFGFRETGEFMAVDIKIMI